MLNSIITNLEKEFNKYGDKLNSPVSHESINKLESEIKNKFNITNLPEQYKEFLKKVNGFEYNGLIIYGVDNYLIDNGTNEMINGIIDNNEIWYENEWQKQFLFLGDADIAWYCFDLNRKIYVELDKPSGDEVQIYEDFYHMIEQALQSRLA